VIPVIKNVRLSAADQARPVLPRREKPGSQAGGLSNSPASQTGPGALCANPSDEWEQDEGSKSAGAGQAQAGDESDDALRYSSGSLTAQRASDSVTDPVEQFSQYRQAYEAGYQAGYAAGDEAGRAEGLAIGEAQGHAQALQEAREQQQSDIERGISAAEACAAAIQQLGEQLTALDGQLKASAEVIAIDLAWAALMRLLGEGSGKREYVAAMVRNVLDQARPQAIVRIGLSAQDLAVLQADGAPEFSSFTLVADERVEAGGCMIETAAGGLDGRLETQLQLLRQVLLARVTAIQEQP
jgi:flagellar assembly protein FliH